MSTAIETAKLVTLGMRFRASYLVQQAGYTLGIASAEGEPLAALLPAGHLDKTAQLRDEVDKATQDRTVRAAEAKQTTVTQNQHMREGLNMETLTGFPYLPTMVRSRQSRLAPHATSGTARSASAARAPSNSASPCRPSSSAPAARPPCPACWTR